MDEPSVGTLMQLREADARLYEERDRRYSEVAAARAEALKIKDEGDKEALRLAREIQTYKDEKANELREQINSERNLYATKRDVEQAVEKMEALTLAQRAQRQPWAIWAAGLVVSLLILYANGKIG